MVLYSKFASQFSGEKKQFENPLDGCRDIKQKLGLILFGTPCTTMNMSTTVTPRNLYEHFFDYNKTTTTTLITTLITTKTLTKTSKTIRQCQQKQPCHNWVLTSL